MSDCVFCKIVAGQIPSAKVYEDDQTLAFMDLGQVNPGHVLVVLKAHAENLFELSEDQAAAVARTCAKLARVIRSVFSPEGLTVFQANGKAAWQTVFHYHVHLLPRSAADGMAITWPAKNPPRDVLEAYAGKLRNALG